MVVVDSGVWIDYFRDDRHPAMEELVRLLSSGSVRLVVPDLVYFEVLRGFRHERDHRQAKALLEAVGIEDSGGRHIAFTAAQHYRDLRQAGVTPRSAIDVLVATFCIEHDYLLLHRDRDFDAFEARRGLRVWRH